MGKYKNTDITQEITKEEAISLVQYAKHYRDKTIIILLYLFPVRPEELVDLKKNDFKLIGEPINEIEFVIITAKLRRYFPKRDFAIRKGEIPDILFYSLLRYISSIPNNSKLFNISKRRIRQIIDEMGMKALNRHLCPYAFRHNALTRSAKEGAGIHDLMYQKGSSDIRSISPYLHAKKQYIKIE